MSLKPMVRKRGSIAVLMKALSRGSSSRSSVCGLGTLTSSISNSLARSREMRASSSFLMSASFMRVFRLVLSRLERMGRSAPYRLGQRQHASGFRRSRYLGAAVAESFLHARPQHQHQAQREDTRGQGAQEEDGVIVVRDHQRLVERALGELAENEADDQADQRIAVAPQEIAEQAEEDRNEHVHHVALVGVGAEQRDDQEHRRHQLDP